MPSVCPQLPSGSSVDAYVDASAVMPLAATDSGISPDLQPEKFHKIHDDCCPCKVKAKAPS
ncbi:hypothetical protein P7K49_024636, partial [Saguinus oedipus]